MIFALSSSRKCKPRFDKAGDIMKFHWPEKSSDSGLLIRVSLRIYGLFDILHAHIGRLANELKLKSSPALLPLLLLLLLILLLITTGSTTTIVLPYLRRPIRFSLRPPNIPDLCLETRPPGTPSGEAGGGLFKAGSSVREPAEDRPIDLLFEVIL